MSTSRHLDAWSISETDFPVSGSPAEKLEFCLNYAILAPSTYNNQPWYFKIENNTVSVYCDRRYALPVADPDDRQMMMSCAAALFNLRLAIRYFGYQENTQLLPNAADENLIARVQMVEGPSGISESEKDLFKAIVNRHHNRGAYKNTPVPADQLSILKNAAKAEGAWLYICEGDERDIVGHMIAEADNIQRSQKPFRRELAAWANERRFVSGDGFPDYARPFKEIVRSTNPRILRRFEAAPGQVVMDEDITAGSPVLAILGSDKGGDAHRLYAGQAFMRVFLQAEALGLSMSTLNQPCEVPELRLRLHDEIEEFQGRAHYVLRIGYSDPAVNYSPRRPLETFIDRSEAPMHAAAPNQNQAGFWNGVFSLFKKS